MLIDVLTLFPQMFDGPLSESIVKRAREKGRLNINLIDFRDFCTDKHKQVDDYPYGGGAGMVIKPEPLFRAVEFLKQKREYFKNESSIPIIYLTPQGRLFNQQLAKELGKKEYLILICGHYKDIDYRVREHLITDEISIGDYVLSGGEIPAMVLIDAVTRLLPDVLGNEESAKTDSFEDKLLDCPYYTRPKNFHGYKVPEVLLSGNHQKIAQWRKHKALEITKKNRTDLFS